MLSIPKVKRTRSTRANSALRPSSTKGLCTLPVATSNSSRVPMTASTPHLIIMRRIQRFSEIPRLRFPLVISLALQFPILFPRIHTLILITSLTYFLSTVDINSAIRRYRSHSPIPSRIKATTRSPTHIIPRQTMTTLITSLHLQLRRIFNNGEHSRTKSLFQTLVSINPSTILKLDRVISLTSLQTLSSCTLINASSLRPIPLTPTLIPSKKVSIIATTRSRSINSRGVELFFTDNTLYFEDGAERSGARKEQRRGRRGDESEREGRTESIAKLDSQIVHEILGQCNTDHCR